MTDSPSDSRNIDLRSYLQDRYGRQEPGWAAWLFDRLPAPAEASVLDIGAGTGLFWALNAGRIPPAWRITLTDIDLGGLRRSDELLASAPPRISRAQADAQALPFRAERFHLVLANGVLDYLDQPGQVCAEARRVLLPRGRFIVVLAGENHLRELSDLVRPVLPRADFGRADGWLKPQAAGELLKRSFGDVESSVFRDTLRFTQAEPILAYIHSELAAGSGGPDARLAALDAALQTRLRARGELHVSTEKIVWSAGSS